MKEEEFRQYERINEFLDRRIPTITFTEFSIYNLIMCGPTKQDLPQKIKDIFEQQNIPLYYSNTPYKFNESPAIENYLAFIIAINKLDIDAVIDKIPKDLKKTTQAKESLPDDSLPPPSPVKMFSDNSHDLEKIDPELLRFIYNQIIKSRIHENKVFSNSRNSSTSQQSHIPKPPQSNTHYTLLQKELLMILEQSGKIVKQVIDETQQITLENEPENIGKNEKATTREEARKIKLGDEQVQITTSCTHLIEELKSINKDVSELLIMPNDDSLNDVDKYKIDEDQIRNMQKLTSSIQEYIENSDAISQNLLSLEEKLSLLEKQLNELSISTKEKVVLGENQGTDNRSEVKPQVELSARGRPAVPLRTSARCCIIS
jgi:hypothetical protein